MIFSLFIGNKLANFKNQFRKFKENIEKAKNQPSSKRKSFFMCFHDF